MSTIVTRAGKGSPLSHNQADANWTNLNTDKLEKDGSIALTGDLAAGTNKITGLGDPTAAQDAATKNYVDTNGGNPFDQDLNTTDDVEFAEVTAAEFIGPLRGPILIKASAGEALTKGDAVYISGISGNKPVVSLADADVAGKMPAVGLANATVSSSADVDVLAFGQITNIDTTQNIGGTWAEGDSLYVNTVAGQLTKTQPSGETGLVQKIAKIEKVHASTGLLLIQGAGRTNATPNLNDGNIFIGDASNYVSTTPFAISLDATPELGGDLGTGSNRITSTGDVLIDKTLMDQTHADYSLTIDNQNNSGLGLRIKAGNSDSGTYGSLAVLSVSDKDNDNKFIVKASGEVVSYYNHTIKDVLISDSSISTLNTGDNLNITTNAGTLSLNSLNWPAADGTSGQILQTNGSGQLSFVTNSGGSGIAAVVDDTTPQLGGTLDQNGQNIDDASRNYQIIGAPADPTSSGFDAFGNSAGRAHGPATVSVLTSNQSDRVYQNVRAASQTLSANISGGTAGGRIRQNFTEGNLITDGNDLTTTGFGRGHHALWLTGQVSNDHASDASTVTESTTLSVIPQYTGNQALTMSNGHGVAVQAFCESNNSTVSSFIGYMYEHPFGLSGTALDNFTTTNHWSFKSTSSTAKLQNDGPAILSGLNYPTSDGSADQVLKTDGSGNLTFATVSGSSFTGDLNGNDLTDSSQDITIKPTGSTQAELKLLDTGNDSMKLQLVGINTDAVGGQIDAVDQTGARANMSFTAKQTDFDSNGGSVRFKTNATSETIRFLPAQGAASANDLEISSDGLGSISVISNGNVSFGTAAAQVSMPGGTQRIQLNKLVEMPLYTTTERNALGTVTQGSVLFNTTTDKLQVYANGAWVDLH